MVVPETLVVGVIAVVEAVPPVGTVYHCKVLPDAAVAVNGLAIVFKQSVSFNAIGAVGLGLTFTVIAVRGLSQGFEFKVASNLKAKS